MIEVRCEKHTITDVLRMFMHMTCEDTGVNKKA